MKTILCYGDSNTYGYNPVTGGRWPEDIRWKPVDAVVMMLGTNDLKMDFGLCTEEIAAGAERLVQEIHDFAAEKQKFCPKIILMSPPEIGENISKLTFGDHFDDSAITRSKEFPACYKAVADRNGCIFLDAAQAAKPSEEDALHLMPEEHKSLAESVYACIKENQI